MTILGLAMAAAPAAHAQSSSEHVWGNGVIYHLNDDGYTFQLGGVTQSFAGFESSEGTQVTTLDTRFAYFNFKGEAKEERLKFFLQADFTRPKLLLDGYFTWEALPGFELSFGQRQGIANNRELLMYENTLQFIERSTLSQTYAELGREFGAFLQYKMHAGKVVLKPSISVTSGDGINSFGVDSRDPDIGGFKYSGRLDFLPFGAFLPGNDRIADDLQGEPSPKLLVGLAASTNIGASDPRGEGHGTFTMYDATGTPAYPTYRKLFADALFKYQHFSMMTEYGIATASNLNHLFIAPGTNQFLIPTQISEYLHLGRGYNVQLAQIFKDKWQIQARHSAIQPEFDTNTSSLVQGMQQSTLGLTRFISGNAAKIQAQVSRTTTAQTTTWHTAVAVQFAF